MVLWLLLLIERYMFVILWGHILFLVQVVFSCYRFTEQSCFLKSNRAQGLEAGRDCFLFQVDPVATILSLLFSIGQEGVC